MTNTRITDAEVFERRYPVILREFSLREGSGGRGQHPGGDGVIRDIEFRIPVQVSILSERRVYHPYGLEGGEDAACGQNIWVRRIGSSEETTEATSSEGDESKWRHINLGAKNTASMQPGDRIIVKTPGGGAWGKLGEKSCAVKAKDPREAWRKGSVANRLETAETSA